MNGKSKEKEDFKLHKIGEIRTRFAPSPTGFFHIGSARTALFNYIFAKKNKGSFILRIEDTDVERSKSEFEQDIIDSLKWLGIEWQEFYKQSERKDIYKKYLEKLLTEGKAYYCFCSEKDLEELKQYQMSIGQPIRYDNRCAKLSKKEVEKRLSQGEKAVIRFKIPLKKIKFNDTVRGKVEFDMGLIGDIVIAKDLDAPLYNFTNVVDDYEMKITNVIRGEDHLSNTPKQILMQKALGFSSPEYAHLPLILGKDRSKLSKRHGAVSVRQYKEQGYLPEAIINFLAFLGWNPGTEKEIYSLPALIKDFSVSGIQKGGATFNIQRLDFLNGFYIRQKSTEKLTELCLPYLIKEDLITPIFKEKERVPQLTGYFGREVIQKFVIKDTKEEIGFDYLEKVVSVYQERLKKLSEIPELTDFFFKDKLSYNKELLRWKEMGGKHQLEFVFWQLENILSKIEKKNWNFKNLENLFSKKVEIFSLKDRGYFLWPLRAALSGKKSSASPFEIAEILGKEKTLKRIKQARELFK